MALIPQQPKQQRALVAIILAVGGAYAFWEYWFTPRQDEVAGTEARIERLQVSNREAQITSARGGGDLEERNALYAKHVMQLETLVPESQEVPALITRLNQVARTNRVTVSGMNPEPDVPVGFYVQQSWGWRPSGSTTTWPVSLPRLRRWRGSSLPKTSTSSRTTTPRTCAST